MQLSGMSVDDVLTTTRAVRRRLDLERPVERPVVEECLDLAFQAPNGSNGQSWAWTLIDDPAVRQQAADIYRRGLDAHLETYGARRSDGKEEAPSRGLENIRYLADNMHRVPVLLVPTIGQRYGSTTTHQQASRWGSVMPAVWSFMLALRSRGLGSCWTTAHLHLEEDMARLLGIDYPENSQVGLFPVAYTVGLDFKRADRSRSYRHVGWNTWPGVD